MSDQVEPTGGNDVDADKQLFEGLEDFLDKLVPPDSVDVSTFDGKSFTLPGSLPARRQVAVFRLIRELMEMKEVSQALMGLGGDLAATNIVDVVVGLCTSGDVMQKLGDIFTEAYPDVAQEVGDPLDAFALEELVASLVPFSERFLKKVGGGMASLAKTATLVQN